MFSIVGNGICAVKRGEVVVLMFETFRKTSRTDLSCLDFSCT